MRRSTRASSKCGGCTIVPVRILRDKLQVVSQAMLTHEYHIGPRREPIQVKRLLREKKRSVVPWNDLAARKVQQLFGWTTCILKALDELCCTLKLLEARSDILWIQKLVPHSGFQASGGIAQRHEKARGGPVGSVVHVPWEGHAQPGCGEVQRIVDRLGARSGGRQWLAWPDHCFLIVYMVCNVRRTVKIAQGYFYACTYTRTLAITGLPF